MKRARQQRGPVEALCAEIDFPFSAGMENPRVIVAFTRALVMEVAHMHYTAQTLADSVGTPSPAASTGAFLDRVLDLLNVNDIQEMVAACESLHDEAGRLNPDDAYPANHFVDMLSSCVSAIRFGCAPRDDNGFGSRHAAAAAQHIWAQKYGVRLFDENTPAWEKDWARGVLVKALVALAFPPSKGADEETPKGNHNA